VATDDPGPELHYVIRTVEGARHAGWYRLLDESRLQVMSEGRCITVPASSGSLEDQAREVLKDIASMGPADASSHQASEEPPASS
jgi:hypothetical protein